MQKEPVNQQDNWDPYRVESPKPKVVAEDDGSLQYEGRLDPVITLTAGRKTRWRLAFILGFACAGVLGTPFLSGTIPVALFEFGLLYLLTGIALSIAFIVILERRTRKQVDKFSTMFFKIRISSQGMICHREQSIGTYCWSDVLKARIFGDVLFFYSSRQPAQPLMLPLNPLDKTQRHQVLEWAKSDKIFDPPISPEEAAQILGVEDQSLIFEKHPEAIEYRGTITRSEFFKARISIARILRLLGAILALFALLGALIGNIIGFLTFGLTGIGLYLLVFGLSALIYYRRTVDVEQLVILNPTAMQLKTDKKNASQIFQYAEMNEVQIKKGLLRFKAQRTGPQLLLVPIHSLSEEEAERLSGWLQSSGAHFSKKN